MDKEYKERCFRLVRILLSTTKKDWKDPRCHINGEDEPLGDWIKDEIKELFDETIIWKWEDKNA